MLIDRVAALGKPRLAAAYQVQQEPGQAQQHGHVPQRIGIGKYRGLGFDIDQVDRDRQADDPYPPGDRPLHGFEDYIVPVRAGPAELEQQFRERSCEEKAGKPRGQQNQENLNYPQPLAIDAR